MLAISFCFGYLLTALSDGSTAVFGVVFGPYYIGVPSLLVILIASLYFHRKQQTAHSPVPSTPKSDF